MKINTNLVIRISLAFSLFYAAVKSTIDPSSWSGFFPSFVSSFIDINVALILFSIVEVSLGILLLIGIKTKYLGLIYFSLLAGMVVFNLSLMDILFRDVSLALVGLALYFDKSSS